MLNQIDEQQQLQMVNMLIRALSDEMAHQQSHNTAKSEPDFPNEIEEALRDIYRVLKPGGTIYFTEPNMLNPQIAMQKNIPWIKRKLGDSPDETAFFRWPLRRLPVFNHFS